jgi:hypothetical protein
MMRLLTYFALAFASACALAAPAGAQTYGGASSSDLLGYRSSVGHYYNRSLGSKVRSNATRRRSTPQPRPRPSGTKPGTNTGTPTRPASSARPAPGPTTFTPVAPMVAPQALAAKVPSDQKQIEEFYTSLLESYRALVRKKGAPENDVARAASFAVSVSYSVYNDGVFLTERQLEGVRAQMREVFSEDQDFQRLSDRDKQELYESYAIIGMYISSIYDGARKANHEKGIAQMRHLAQTQLEETFGASVEQLAFTDDGVKYR